MSSASHRRLIAIQEAETIGRNLLRHDASPTWHVRIDRLAAQIGKLARDDAMDTLVGLRPVGGLTMAVRLRDAPDALRSLLKPGAA